MVVIITGGSMNKLFAFMLPAFLTVLALPAFSGDSIVTKQAIKNWIVKEASKPKPSSKTITRIVDSVYEQSRKHNLDPYLILSVMHRESRFNPNARSKAGAHGLMQVMTKVHKDKLKGRSPFNIEVNIEVGSKILADCVRSRSTRAGALQCYSGGARKYEKHLMTAFNSLRRAEVLHRFTNEKPLRKLPDFTQAFNTEKRLAKVKVAGYSSL